MTALSIILVAIKQPHLLVRYEVAEEPGTYKFFGYCGYAGSNKKEFIDPTRQKIPSTLCRKCKEKLTCLPRQRHRQKGGQAMKKCKKCNQPVYVYEPGLGSQKPYVSALCIDHIYENFAALGILPTCAAAGRPPGGDHSALGDCRATLEVIRKMAGEEEE